MFDCYISLGPACPMASSMSKYGLRSFSGVFDWLITSDFKWVLHYIETDFKDFLLQENLERYDESPIHFRDKLSDVKFIHDTENFNDEYNKLKEKYNRRINRFLEKMKSTVCYLRSVRNNKELEYIQSNVGYIQCVIQKYNSNSEILFLFDNNLSVPDDFGFRYYRLSGIWGGIHVGYCVHILTMQKIFWLSAGEIIQRKICLKILFLILKKRIYI